MIDPFMTSEAGKLAAASHRAVPRTMADITLDAAKAEIDTIKEQAIKANQIFKIDEVLAKRHSSYGNFCDNALLAQDLKFSVRNTKTWVRLTDVQKEAIEMVLFKISRIVTGDPKYKDNYVDIIGYTQLAIDELDGKIR